jgi:hypothetical protein
MPHVRLARPLLESIMNATPTPPRFKRTADGQRWRWSPPPPLVRIGLITRVLMRQPLMPTPEARLVVAIIVQAISDCIEGNDREREDARRFLRSDRLDYWSNLLGIEAALVRQVAMRAGYLIDESALWQPVTRQRKRPLPAEKKTARQHAGL